MAKVELKVDGNIVYSGDCACGTQEIPERVTTIDAAMAKDLGAKEWDSTVEKIQKWYYGSYVKMAWCATSVSYYAEKCGFGKQTGKHESVDRMKDYMNVRGALDCTKNYGGGSYKPKKGDILFMSGLSKYADCTHVGIITEVNNQTGDLKYISGNADDAIKIKSGNYKTNRYFVAFGYINYSG